MSNDLELNGLKKLSQYLNGITQDSYTHVRYKDVKNNRGNLLYHANQAGIVLKLSTSLRYLLFGDHLKNLTKLMDEKCPRLQHNASLEEVKEALDFVIKNYKKI